ncbi:hypothetical protein TNCV_4233651 [Trichonephila clavipes]|nr:hypothetical protein TNCV_4233651 [Trichonephila clavipes]
MKITPLKVLRIDADKTLRLSVAFQFTECPRTGSKKVSVGVGKRENLAHSVTVNSRSRFDPGHLDLDIEGHLVSQRPLHVLAMASPTDTSIWNDITHDKIDLQRNETMSSRVSFREHGYRVSGKS